jgi:hypothetical protein
MSEDQFVKIWSDARTDEKLQVLSDECFRVWFKLLLYSADQRPRGTIKNRTKRLLALECSERDVGLLVKAIDQLEELSLIETMPADQGCLTVNFVNFGKRNMLTAQEIHDKVMEDIPVEKTSTPPMVKPIVNNDQRTLDEVDRIANEINAIGDWPYFASAACKMYSAHWVIDAMNIARSRKIMSWRYVASILNTYQQQGGPTASSGPRFPVQESSAPRKVFTGAGMTLGQAKPGENDGDRGQAPPSEHRG